MASYNQGLCIFFIIVFKFVVDEFQEDGLSNTTGQLFVVERLSHRQHATATV